MRVVDAFLSLPWILKMLVLIVTFGTGVEVLIPTLAFFYGIPVVRIARAATHDVVARDFVVAACAGSRPHVNHPARAVAERAGHPDGRGRDAMSGVTVEEPGVLEKSDAYQ